jgi:hypothetical protein
VKVGDLVTLKNVDRSWGKVALITKIHVTTSGTGQIHVITASSPRATIPWASRHRFIELIDSTG